MSETAIPVDETGRPNPTGYFVRPTKPARKGNRAQQYRAALEALLLATDPDKRVKAEKRARAVLGRE